ncbi:AT hook motif domain containing protein, expressed [Datura stramonium]|uniref:AT-hook motif nuclear-localized protein n=1 Tax=Datura stramonium TaxID=4076 RepID=A0ABS8SXV3_DATST|nr:AT hook motif domain containing protein, expressed [Datura stramonium]
MSVGESNGVQASMQHLGSPFAANGNETYNPLMQPFSSSTSPTPCFQVPGDPSITTTAPLSINSTSVEPVKRKRGRPRKYAPEGSSNPGMISPSPTLSASQVGGGGGGFSSPTPQAAEAAVSAVKKGRGRPPGSGRKQQVADLGSKSAGVGFRLHVITIKAGEFLLQSLRTLSNI